MNQDRFQFVNAQKADTPPEADCWANRSENMRCKSCIWFAAKPSQPGEYTNIGRCRRHAPTMSGYPVVYVNDWCGDHKLNEAWGEQSNSWLNFSFLVNSSLFRNRAKND